MVSLRCKLMVKKELEKLGLHYTNIELGMVETEEEIEWETSDFIPVITELRSLAIKANEKSKGMYFWNSL